MPLFVIFNFLDGLLSCPQECGCHASIRIIWCSCLWSLLSLTTSGVWNFPCSVQFYPARWQSCAFSRLPYLPGWNFMLRNWGGEGEDLPKMSQTSIVWFLVDWKNAVHLSCVLSLASGFLSDWLWHFCFVNVSTARTLQILFSAILEVSLTRYSTLKWKL